MNDKAIGAMMLVASAACCTLGMGMAKIAFGINRGLLHVGGSGTIPDSPRLDFVTITAAVALAVLGLKFLFKKKD
jgi:hypothetical protein